MNCDLWRSHVLEGVNFVSGICKLKPNKTKNLFFVLKKLGFSSPEKNTTILYSERVSRV